MLLDAMSPSGVVQYIFTHSIHCIGKACELKR